MNILWKFQRINGDGLKELSVASINALQYKY